MTERRTSQLVTAAAAALLLSAAAWDVHVLTQWETGPLACRLASPYTVSYALFSASQSYPALAWLLGLASFAVARWAWRPVALVWWLVQGHLWWMTYRLVHP